jgi:hypothetical protein
MSSTRHTPGPWRAGYESKSGRRNMIIVRAEDLDGQPYVALCPSVSCDEHMANALLIAAAPRLLEACLEVIAVAEKMAPAKHSKIEEAALDLCREAVALATGGPR